MRRTIFDHTPDGLRERLRGMERQLADLQRVRNPPPSYVEPPEVDGGGSGPGLGQLLILSVAGDSIASGGDYVTFDSELHRRGFDTTDIADGQTIIWPADTTGSIQVEFAWDSYDGGGTVEIEVDGEVPAWGLVGSGTSGSGGSKRRGVDIESGSAVRIKVTQTSGAAQTADVAVEFKVDGPTSPTVPDSSSMAVQFSPAIAERPVTARGETFFDQTFDATWDGTGTVVLAGASDGITSLRVDDLILLDVTHDDGSTATYTHEFGPSPTPPRDVTDYFEPGTNSVRVRFQDVGGSVVSATAVWLVQV